MKQLFLSFTCAISLVGMNLNAQKLVYPPTEKTGQKDRYFGVEVADPYRWLEDDTAAKTAKWVDAQIAFTNKYLNTIPYRKEFVRRLTQLWNYEKYSAPVRHGKFYTFYKNDGLQNQSVLYIQQGINGKAEVLIDPNKLSDDGTVALQAVAFSKKQKYIAYSVSASGSDWQEIYVMDVATKKLLKDKIEHVKFTGISWKGDEGFYYSGYSAPKDEATKYSAKTEYQKVFFHKIGTPQSEDVLVYEDADHPLRYVRAGLTEDERFLVLNISEGTDGDEIKVCDLRKGVANEFVTIVPGFSTNASVVDNIGDKLIVMTNADAPNYKVVLIDPNRPDVDSWETLIAEQPQKLDGVSTAGGKLFAQYLKDVSTQVVQYDLKGKKEHDIDLPGIGTASGFRGYKDDKEFYYTFTNLVHPPTIYKYDIKTGKSSLYRKSSAKFDPELFESKQVFYPSADGTLIPMFIVHKKGLKLDGNNPTMLYAYGGFNISLTPTFSMANIPFLEAGGVYCVANIRGGGEYGEDWHKAGMLSNKQTVFDDFIAAAEYLIQQKYTSASRLAIRGGSNGGLLVGACMTQRPDLFAVAIPQVGVLDMLRYHKFTVGWGWVVEYGSSDNEEDFNYLIRYSPLHNVKEGVCYPATMITTADHDDRVVPAHSFKFAAELQDKQSCDRPALIRIDKNAGHGAGKPTAKIIEEVADIMAFSLWNMGIPDVNLPK